MHARGKSLRYNLHQAIFCFFIIVKMGETVQAAQGLVRDFEFCEISKLTRTVVDNCPRDYAELVEAANKKNCSSIKSTCIGRLEYHCVINPWGNLTVEVCAPATHIRSGFCAEYNEGGGKIQEFYKSTCSACNKEYLSTDAYKYQECYPKSKIAGNDRRARLAKGDATGKEDSSPPRQAAQLSNKGFQSTAHVRIQLTCLQISLYTLYFVT